MQPPATIDGLPVKSYTLTGDPQQTDLGQAAKQVSCFTVADSGGGVPNLITAFADGGTVVWMHAAITDASTEPAWKYGDTIHNPSPDLMYLFMVDAGESRHGKKHHAPEVQCHIRAYHAT